MRSRDVNDSNYTPSVLDEHEAQDVLSYPCKESLEAGNVWGDIERNKLLDSVREPPKQLTPGPDKEFHKAINMEHFARLE